MNFQKSIKQVAAKGIILKLIMVGTLSMLLNGCSSFDYLVDKGQHYTNKAGESLGLVKERKMTVPNYYSIAEVPKKPQAGQVFKLAE